MLEEDESQDEIIRQARLLIRIASWVSAMDVSGGKSSDRQERKAVIETIRKFQRERDYKTLYPAFETALENHKAWDEWGRDVSDVTLELTEAAPDLPLILRQCIYDLAYCVAVRYRERNWLAALLASLRVSFLNFLSPSTERIDLPSYLNISQVERSALNEVAQILDLPRKILK